jgi:hypothetical protein
VTAAFASLLDTRRGNDDAGRAGIFDPAFPEAIRGAQSAH